MIYPKSFAVGKRNIETSSCFVLMPFLDDFNVIYGWVKEMLAKLDIKCNRADDIFESLPILSTIIEKILRAEFIVADLTSRNPNVFYEVGLAHSFRDPENVILIAQSMEDIPFDIRHLPVTIYNKENKFLLEDNIKRRISSARDKIQKKRFLLDYFSDLEFSFLVVEKTFGIIQEKNPQFVENIFLLLSDQDDFAAKRIDAHFIKQIVSEIDSLSILADGDTRRLLYKVKLNILTKTANNPTLTEYSIAFLGNPQRDIFSASINDDLLFAADFACNLVKSGIHKPSAISWLLNYLRNSRVGGVDVIRNKIDEFLVKIADEEVESALLRLLVSDNPTLREAAVDILTQKKSPNAYSFILTTFLKESNVYVVRSMVNGLGRYDNDSSSTVVLEWFKNNQQLIKYNNARFLYDVAIDFFQKLKMFQFAEEIVFLKNSTS